MTAPITELITGRWSVPDLSTLKQRVTSVEKLVADDHTGLPSKATKTELDAKVDQATFNTKIQRLDTALEGKVDKEVLSVDIWKDMNKHIELSEKELIRAVGEEFTKQFVTAFDLILNCVAASTERKGVD